MGRRDYIDAERQVVVNALHGYETSIEPHEMQDQGYRQVLSAAMEISDNGGKPDLVTIIHKIKASDFESASASHLSDLFASGLPTKRIEAHEEIVREAHTLRNIEDHARSLIYEIEDGASVQDLLVKVQKEPTKFLKLGKRGETIELQQVIMDHLKEIESRRFSDRDTMGTSTPWSGINRLTNGWQPTDLIIIAGRPSMGKTAMAMQAAFHAAQHDGPVFVASLEMSKSQLVDRMLSSLSRVDSDRIRKGYLTDIQLAKIETAAEKTMDWHPLLINDTPRLSASEIRMLASQAQKKYGKLSLVVIDYLNLMKTAGGQQRYLDIQESTGIMKQVAKELEVPVVLLAQLNRKCEEETDKRPQLSHLRESGDIEQDADLVIMLYRDEYYCNACNANSACDIGHQGMAEAIMRKQRNGPTGTTKLVWHPTFTMFSDLSSNDYSDTEEKEWDSQQTLY